MNQPQEKRHTAMRTIPISLAILAAGFAFTAYKVRFGTTFTLLTVISLLAVTIATVILYFQKKQQPSGDCKQVVRAIPLILLSAAVAVAVYFCFDSAQVRIAREVESLKSDTPTETIVENYTNKPDGTLRFFVRNGETAEITYEYENSLKRESSLNDYYFYLKAVTDLFVTGKYETISDYYSMEYFKFTIELFDKDNRKVVAFRDSTNDPQLKSALSEGKGTYKLEMCGYRIPIVNQADSIRETIDQVKTAKKFKLYVDF